MTDPRDPLAEPGDERRFDTVDEHPGQQCYEAHPERPHRVPVPRQPVVGARPGDALGSSSTSPPNEPPDDDLAGGAIVDKATALVLLGSDPWARFDTWAERAFALAERAVDAAVAEGERNEKATLSSETIYDPRATTLMDAARLCSEIAREAGPLGALGGLPSRMPDLELVVPPMLG